MSKIRNKKYLNLFLDKELAFFGLCLLTKALEREKNLQKGRVLLRFCPFFESWVLNLD